MSDHDFEKQVQLRLEQLKLRPSNAVWAEVERNIRLQKRRRRLLIWLPAALLIIIAGGYLALQQTGHQDMATAQTAETVVKSTPANTPVSPNQTPSTDNSTLVQENQPAQNDLTNTPASADKPAIEQVTPPAAATNASEPAATSPAIDKPAVRQPDTHATVAIDQQGRTAKPDNARANKINKNNTTRNKPPRSHQRDGNDIAARKPSAAAALPVLNVPAPVTKPVEDTEKDLAVADSSIAAVPTADSTLAMVTPVDSAGVDSTATAPILTKAPVTQTTPALTAATVQPKKKSRQESKWQFGVTAEGGASGVSSDGLFGFLEKKEEAVPDLAAAPNYNFASNNAINFAPQFPRPPINRASSLSMGPSFSIGGFAQRKLGNRVSLSAGLQYTMLSARQIVGNKFNSNRTVNRAPATSQLVESYYDNSMSSSNTYTNKYHFFELPVTLHAQLNEGKRLPFGVDVGFSASRMFKTTALHYDGIGNVYYKDDALFNKTQWTASAGFFVKLFNQTAHPLSVGPVMRYNMSPLLVKDFSTGQHLWSVGLRASVLLKK